MDIWEIPSSNLRNPLGITMQTREKLKHIKFAVTENRKG